MRPPRLLAFRAYLDLLWTICLTISRSDSLVDGEARHVYSPYDLLSMRKIDLHRRCHFADSRASFTIIS